MCLACACDLNETSHKIRSAAKKYLRHAGSARWRDVVDKIVLDKFWVEPTCVYDTLWPWCGRTLPRSGVNTRLISSHGTCALPNTQHHLEPNINVMPVMLYSPVSSAWLGRAFAVALILPSERLGHRPAKIEPSEKMKWVSHRHCAQPQFWNDACAPGKGSLPHCWWRRGILEMWRGWNLWKVRCKLRCLQARPCIHKALAEPQDAWSQKLGLLTVVHSVWTVLVSVLTLHETVQAAVRLETSSSSLAWMQTSGLSSRSTLVASLESSRAFGKSEKQNTERQFLFCLGQCRCERRGREKIIQRTT